MHIEPAGPRFKALHRAGMLEIEIPARRSWFGVLFLCAWMGGWVFGEVSVIKQLMHPTGKNSYAFLLFWLAGWTLGGVLAAISLLWQLAGRELLAVSGGSMEYRVEVLGMGYSRSYRTAEIREWRVLAGTQSSNNSQAGFSPPFFGSGGSIAFDFGARTVKIAPGLDEAEAKSLVLELEAKLSRKTAMVE